MSTFCNLLILFKNQTLERHASFMTIQRIFSAEIAKKHMFSWMKIDERHWKYFYECSNICRSNMLLVGCKENGILNYYDYLVIVVSLISIKITYSMITIISIFDNHILAVRFRLKLFTVEMYHNMPLVRIVTPSKYKLTRPSCMTKRRLRFWFRILQIPIYIVFNIPIPIFRTLISIQTYFH